MKPQFCRVGRMTPMTQTQEALNVLTHRYESFAEKASQSIDSRLIDFFEGQAKKLKRLLEELK